MIEGSEAGILIESASGTVVNHGAVSATSAYGFGIAQYAGTVTNFGTVVAGANGTGIGILTGNVTNFGTILAPTATAVYIRYGTFVNEGVVEGRVSGIRLSGAAGGPLASPVRPRHT